MLLDVYEDTLELVVGYAFSVVVGYVTTLELLVTGHTVVVMAMVSVVTCGVLGQFGTVGDAKTDEEILSAIRQAARTIFHPTCTARMSPKNAKWGVVDPELLVKGAAGLRIVDASVFVGL